MLCKDCRFKSGCLIISIFLFCLPRQNVRIPLERHFVDFQSPKEEICDDKWCRKQTFKDEWRVVTCLIMILDHVGDASSLKNVTRICLTH